MDRAGSVTADYRIGRIAGIYFRMLYGVLKELDQGLRRFRGNGLHGFKGIWVFERVETYCPQSHLLLIHVLKPL